MRGIVIAGLMGAAAVASANLATFDTMSEGTNAGTIVDGGITFHDLDQRFPWGGPYNFAIEDASGDLTGRPGFSSPNTLGFGGWSPGTGTGFSRLGGFTFDTAGLASGASLELFTFQFDGGITVALQGYRNGVMIASDSVAIGLFQINHYTLSVSGQTFDSFKIFSSGSTNEGCVFAVVDNVNVTPVPEPATMAALALGATGLLARRRKRA